MDKEGGKPDPWGEMRELLNDTARRARFNPNIRDDPMAAAELLTRLTAVAKDIDPPEQAQQPVEPQYPGLPGTDNLTQAVVRSVMHHVPPGAETRQSSHLPAVRPAGAVMARRNGKPLTGNQDKLGGIIPREKLRTAAAIVGGLLLTTAIYRGHQQDSAPESGSANVVAAGHAPEAVTAAAAAAPHAAEAPASKPGEAATAPVAPQAATQLPAANGPPLPDLAVGLPAAIPVLNE